MRSSSSKDTNLQSSHSARAANSASKADSPYSLARRSTARVETANVSTLSLASPKAALAVFSEDSKDQRGNVRFDRQRGNQVGIGYDQWVSSVAARMSFIAVLPLH